MKIVTIIILCSKGHDRQFMLSGTYAVSTDEEIRASFWALAEPLIADGLTIRDQLFIVTPDEVSDSPMNEGSLSLALRRYPVVSETIG